MCSFVNPINDITFVPKYVPNHMKSLHFPPNLNWLLKFLK